MRKQWLSLVLLLALMLSACNAATTPAATEVPAATEAPTATTEAAAATNTAPVVVGAEPGQCQTSPSIFPAPKADSWRTWAPITAADHVIGPETPRLTIIEYADFTCPYCAMFAPGMSQLAADYPDMVQYVYRNFAVGHRLSNISIQAAEAAGLQGHYWEMYEILFNQDTWQTWNALSDADFLTWVIEQAGTIPGMDVARFTADLTSEAMVQKVADDTAAAQAAGLNATPSIFILLDNQLMWAINIDTNDQLTPSYANLSAILGLWILQDWPGFGQCPDMALESGVTYTATIHTTQGDMTVDLFADQAPLTVNSFIYLAELGWFDNVPFHRVLDGFVAQVGDPTGTGIGGPGYEFGDEITPELNFDQAGMLGMANAGSGTNGSQFFITLAATPNLDQNYTVFGQVTSGMEVLDLLTRVDPSSTDAQPTPDRILSITIERN